MELAFDFSSSRPFWLSKLRDISHRGISLEKYLKGNGSKAAGKSVSEKRGMKFKGQKLWTFKYVYPLIYNA